MEAVDQLAPTVGTASACRALDVSRATWYRHQQVPEDAVSPTPSERPLIFREPQPVQQASEPARTSPRALSHAERQSVRDVLHSDHYVDQSPTEVYADLLDEGTYYCSARTMYRILEAEHETRERRDQACRPHYARPELHDTRLCGQPRRRPVKLSCLRRSPPNRAGRSEPLSLSKKEGSGSRSLLFPVVGRHRYDDPLIAAFPAPYGAPQKTLHARLCPVVSYPGGCTVSLMW